MDTSPLLAQIRTLYEQGFLAGLDAAFETTAGRLLEHANQAESATKAGRFLDARAALLNQHSALQGEIARQLQRLLDRSLTTAYHWERNAFALSLPATKLSLLDTSVIEDKLALEVLTSQLRNAVETELRDFNLRIMALYGQDEPREQENPFRPYILACSVVSAITARGLVQEICQLLGRELIEAIKPGVADLYRQLNALLDGKQIAAALPIKPRKPVNKAFAGQPELAAQLLEKRLASQAQANGGRPPRQDLLLRWVQMKTRPESVSDADANDAGPAEAPPNWLDARPDAGQLLRQFFAGEAGDRHQPGYTTATGSSLLADSIRRLEAESRQPAIKDGEPQIRNYIFENRARLGGMAHSENEQMVIDIVAMLYEFILRDGQVPKEVRADISRTQFLVLKHGLFEPAVFTQADHPARLLLNRIGAVSLGFSPADPTTLAIRHEISHTIDQLLAADSLDTSLFSSSLSDFERFLGQTLRGGDQRIDRAVTVLESAESRALQFASSSRQIAALLEGLPVGPQLREFLSTAWALVLERVDREDAGQSERYRQAVPQLIWSVLPKSANEDRVTMLKLLPELIGILHSGLALTRLQDVQRQDFLAWLVNAHVLAIRDNEAESPISLASLEAHFADFIRGEAPMPVPQAGDGFDEAFVLEVAEEFDTSMELLDPQLRPDSAVVPAAEPDTDISAAYQADVLAQLRAGVMIEFAIGGIPRRARLNWVSPRSTSLVLTVEEAATPAAISVAMFRRLLAAGQVHFLESEPLFERAVASLLQSADEMEHWVQASKG